MGAGSRRQNKVWRTRRRRRGVGRARQRRHRVALHLGPVLSSRARAAVRDSCGNRASEPRRKVSASAAALAAAASMLASTAAAAAAAGTRAERTMGAARPGPPRARLAVRGQNSAQQQDSQLQRPTRGPGSSLLLRNTRNLAVRCVVAQMPQRAEIGGEQRAQRLDNDATGSIHGQEASWHIRRDIENLKSRATGSLLHKHIRVRQFLKVNANVNIGQNSRSPVATNIDQPRPPEIPPSGGRSLATSLRFLHERHSNQQRPPIQRLGPEQGRDGKVEAQPSHLMPRPSQADVVSSAALAPSKQNFVPRMSVRRLVPPNRSSSGTQTTRVVAGSRHQAAQLQHQQHQQHPQSGRRRSPYNTRSLIRTRSMAAVSERSPPASHSAGRPLSNNICPALAGPSAGGQVWPSAAGTATASANASASTSAWPELNETDEIKANSRGYEWFWSDWHKSHECLVSKDRLEVCFHPQSSESTAACRAAEPLRRNGNQYYWEIQVEKCYGTAVMFGLCTERQRLHMNDYCNLVGLSVEGWSLSHKGLLWHGGEKQEYTSEVPRDEPVTVGLLYNTVRGELSYFLHGRNLGVAFRGLNDIPDELYPVVGSTAKGTRMRLVSSRCGHATLLGRSCFILLKQFARDRHGLVEYLRDQGAPRNLLEYVAEVAKVGATSAGATSG